MRSVDTYSGDDLLYLNPRGIIPVAAVLKKSERRKNPFRERKRFDATDFLETSKTDADEQEDEEERVTTMNKAVLAEMEG